MALLYRNTDKDWQQIGSDDPFWGVLTAPEFRKDALTPEGIEAFYKSGHDHVEWLRDQVQTLFKEPLSARHALDFGCGVGRLTHAMAGVADQVTGQDVSPGMLAKARERQSDNVQFQTCLTGERFDWLHSYIVFQHIPPVRGMEILKDLLSRLPPGRPGQHVRLRSRRPGQDVFCVWRSSNDFFAHRSRRASRCFHYRPARCRTV